MCPESNFITNLKTFEDYVQEHKFPEIRTDWVLWMLKTLRTDDVLNPAWLRAMKCEGDDEPPMSD